MSPSCCNSVTGSTDLSYRLPLVRRIIPRDLDCRLARVYGPAHTDEAKRVGGSFWNWGLASTGNNLAKTRRDVFVRKVGL